ncbi:MAG: hypothetical protein PHR14_09005 [Oscillospiraceae bacterium]|nr:hypothetical protein [Oscillospiraceae bacterium]
MEKIKKINKKIIKYVIGIIILISIITLIVYTYYDNKQRRYDYNEIPGGITAVIEDDTVRFALNFTPGATIDFMGAEGNIFLYEEDGTKCYRKCFYLLASPADVRDNSKYHIIQSVLTYKTNGVIPHFSDDSYRVVEVCYLNSDGSTVILWQRDE